MRQLILSVLVICSLLGLSAPAWSQSVEEATAQRLFEQGRELMARGRFSEACEKFERSQKLDPGVGTQLNLAACYEESGRTASAWLTYTDAAAAARAAGQGDRWQIARRRAAELKKRLPNLVVHVPSPERGLVIKRGEEVLSESLWGEPIPVDPGDVVVTAEYPGLEPWRQQVEVSDSGGTVNVQVPPRGTLERAAPPPGGAAPAPEPAPAPAAAGDDVAATGSGQRTAGWIAGGAGVAALGVGVFFGVKAKSDNEDSKQHCSAADENFCEARGVQLREDAQSAAVISTIGFALGGAALATGVVLILTAPKGSAASAERSVVAAPAVGPGGGGVLVTGAF